MDKSNLETEIKSKAYKLGYDLCGIIKADPFYEYVAHLDERIEHYPESKHLYEGLYKLAYPQETVEWAKSIIVCVRRYSKYCIPQEISKYIAKYYMFDKRLEYSEEYSDAKAFEDYLNNNGLRIYKSGVAARWAAVKAGLGFFGKNNFFYTKFGSWVWIDTWIVDKEMEYEEHVKKNSACPSDCRKCIDACPTKAMSGSLMMNRGKCIAHLSYYSTELISEDLRDKMRTWIYGCDVCQDVCPMNKNKWDNNERFPKLDELAEFLTLENIVEMDEEMFLSIVQPRFWYIEKNGLWIWKCNAIRAMANSNDVKYHKYIMKACTDRNENIRNMAVWARNRLGL